MADEKRFQIESSDTLAIKMTSSATLNQISNKKMEEILKKAKKIKITDLKIKIPKIYL